MAADQTIKWTFEVPASATHVGTLDVSPHFHRSRIFAAGGYDWSISYYPDSLYHHDGIDLCLQLESQGSVVTISSSIAIIDPKVGLVSSLKLVEESPPMELDYADESRRTLTHWVPKSNLIATPSQYQGVDSYLMFEWTITIFKEMPRPTPMLMPMPEPETLLMPIPDPMPKVPAPDVTFSVSGDLFHVHKAILSMHSPVFKAELSSVAAAAVIEVDGMRPGVFEALLHYIYTNTTTLPATEDEDDGSQTMRDLLVAADRYGVEGLKILCEGKLSKMVDVDNVADMLALADDLGSYVLEDACIEFMVASGRMKNVVKSQGYQRLRMKHPLVLVDVLEKYLIFRNLYMSY